MPSWQSPRASGTRAQLCPGPWMQSLTQMSRYFSRQGKGQKRKEARAGTEVCSPVLRPVAAVYTCRTRWRVDSTLFPGHLHTWQPCTCPRACRAIPDVSHSHARRPRSLWPTSDLLERCTGISVSSIPRPAYWGSTAQCRTKPGFCCILSPGRRGCCLQSSIY